MGPEGVELSPTFVLNDDWTPKEPILPESGLLKVSADQERAIRSVRIGVAENALTTKISSGSEYEYLRSELGMNIILPQGKIEELRFKITLKGDGKIGNGVVAIDGFPNDKIEQSYIVSGKIGVGVDKLLEFIPLAATAVGASAAKIPAEVLSKMLKFEVNPWLFQLGYSEKVNVDFSGGKTRTPEWYFKGKGIQHDLNVVLTIKKPIGIKKIDAAIEAAWIYNPGGWPFPDKKYGSDPKNISIYG